MSPCTWHGLVHDLFAVPTFVGWPIACFVMFVLTNAAFAQTPGLVEFGGLFQRVTIVIGFTWLTALGAATLVNGRDLG